MDLKLRWGLQGADLDLEGGDLVVDESLATAALVSVFTDARVPRAPGASPELQDLRGWWGETAGDPYGSLLWTLTRAKPNAETVERARTHALASLRWLVRDGIASAVDVTARRQNGEAIVLEVRLRRGPSAKWATLWEATAALDVEAGGVLLDLAAG